MNIYVGNLSFQTTEDALQEAFGGYGEVASVSVIRDKFSGQSRGFAFVEMPNAAEAQAAIEGLNGTPIEGRPLTVNEARPREPRSDFGGGRSGGAGGGGFDRGGGGSRGGGGGGGRPGDRDRDRRPGGGSRRSW